MIQGSVHNWLSTADAHAASARAIASVPHQRPPAPERHSRPQRQTRPNERDDATRPQAVRLATGPAPGVASPLFVAQWLAQNSDHEHSPGVPHQRGVAAYSSLDSDVEVFGPNDAIVIDAAPALLLDVFA